MKRQETSDAGAWGAASPAAGEDTSPRSGRRPLPRTLRGRLAAVTAASILASIVVFAVVTVLLVRHELRSSLDAALRQRAVEVAELAVSAPAVLTKPGALETPVSGRQISVEVIDAHGRIVARSVTLQAQLLPEDAVARAALVNGRTGIESITLGGRPYRMYAAPIAELGGPAAGGVVLVASDTSDINRTTGHLGVVVAIAGAVIAVLAALAAAMLTRRGLRPLRGLADAAGEIERTADPARRLPPVGPTAADEIERLTGVLNRMLESLEQARAGERRFLADASHELRTPVTALVGNVEYAARHGADPEVLADLRADAVRLARLVDSLLVLERAGGGEPAAEPVDLAELVRAVVAEQAAGAGRAGAGDERADDGQPRVVAGDLEAVTVRGDEAALRRAVGNLVENGLVHGPAGGTVTVSVHRAGEASGDRAGDGSGGRSGEGSGGRAEISVSDEGPGPDPSEHDRLFERFWRGQDASDRPGSGLGLSIVAAIAERHGGRVRVEGSTFTLELPVS